MNVVFGKSSAAAWRSSHWKSGMNFSGGAAEKATAEVTTSLTCMKITIGLRTLAKCAEE